MVKMKIFGANKSKNRCGFEIEKGQSFLNGFRQFLIDLGFDRYDVQIYSFGCLLDDHGEPIEGKEASVRGYVDKSFYFRNKEYDIDVIFGKDRVFLIIYSKSDKQEEISEKIQKFCAF